MKGVCMCRSGIWTDNGVDPREADTARTLHAPEGMDACDEASRQSHALEHREELARNDRRNPGVSVSRRCYIKGVDYAARLSVKRLVSGDSS